MGGRGWAGLNPASVFSWLLPRSEKIEGAYADAGRTGGRRAAVAQHTPGNGRPKQGALRTNTRGTVDRHGRADDAVGRYANGRWEGVMPRRGGSGTSERGGVQAARRRGPPQRGRQLVPGARAAGGVQSDISVWQRGNECRVGKSGEGSGLAGRPGFSSPRAGRGVAGGGAAPRAPAPRRPGQTIRWPFVSWGEGGRVRRARKGEGVGFRQDAGTASKLRTGGGARWERAV